jgi:hypothetical protein
MEQVMKSVTFQRFIVLACLLGLSSTAMASPRRTGNFERSGTFENSRGDSGTFTRTESDEPGSVSGTSSFETSHGTTTHAFDYNWSASTGTGTRSSSNSYANGETSSNSGTVTRTSPGNFTYDGTHTGVNGKTTDVSTTATFNPSTDTRTIDTTYTNPVSGKSATVDRTISSDAATGTRTVDTTKTGPAGNTDTIDKTTTTTTSHGVKTVDTSTTTNGHTVVSDQTLTKTSNGYTLSGSVTGANGLTSTDGSTVAYSKGPGGETTRTQTSEVTGPGGTVHTSSNSETYTQSYQP